MSLDIWDVTKTLWLIARVSPYEQPGDGAGAIFVIGDSTGYGTGAKHQEDSIAGRVGKQFPQYTIRNNSVNGRKIAKAQEVADSIVEHYQLILLQIGANDLLADRNVDDVVKDMKRLIESLTPHTDHMIILTSGNIGAVPRYNGSRADELQAASRAYTNSMISLTEANDRVDFVNLFDEPEDDPFVSEPDVYMAFDGLHPSSHGYEVWFRKARTYFEAVLK